MFLCGLLSIQLTSGDGKYHIKTLFFLSDLLYNTVHTVHSSYIYKHLAVIQLSLPYCYLSIYLSIYYYLGSARTQPCLCLHVCTYSQREYMMLHRVKKSDALRLPAIIRYHSLLFVPYLCTVGTYLPRT